MGNITKKRAGFVTFWLVFGIIANIITPIMNVIEYSGYKNLGTLGIQLVTLGVDISSFSSEVGKYVIILQAVTVVAALLLIIGYGQLLNWHKSGFFILCFVSVLNAIINPLMLKGISSVYAEYYLSLDVNYIVLIVSPLFSILINWAILQIKKDGVSCWKNLESSKK